MLRGVPATPPVPLHIPFVDGTLTLGIWQQVMLLECDTRPRKREVVVQVVGE
jgi:thiamine phosphate synthase YjbQ (UPF0047 family)